MAVSSAEITPWISLQSFELFDSPTDVTVIDDTSGCHKTVAELDWVNLAVDSGIGSHANTKLPPTLTDKIVEANTPAFCDCAFDW